MALTPGTVTREVDASGDDILTFQTAGSVHAQGMAAVDNDGGHAVAQSWAGSGGGALVNNLVVKASPGVLYEARVILDAAATTDRYLHVLNLAGAPSGGETPIWRGVIPGAGEAAESFAIGGLVCSTGIVIAVSSTLLTYTNPGAGEAAIHAGYR